MALLLQIVFKKITYNFLNVQKKKKLFDYLVTQLTKKSLFNSSSICDRTEFFFLSEIFLGLICNHCF